MHVVLELDGQPHELWLVRSDDRVSLEVDDKPYEAHAAPRGDAWEVRIGEHVHRVEVMGPDRARVDGQEVRFRLPLFEPGGAPGQHVSQEGGGSRVKPPMPGRIVSVRVREGQRVAKGEVLLVLEAMKMQNEVVAPRAGVVAKLHVREGQVVDGATPLADLEG